MEQKQKKKVRAAIKHKEEKGREKTPCQLLRVHPFQGNGVKKKKKIWLSEGRRRLLPTTATEKKKLIFFFLCVCFSIFTFLMDLFIKVMSMRNKEEV